MGHQSLCDDVLNFQFGFECECKKGSVTRKGAAKGTNCQLECHVALVELPTFDIDEKIRKVQAELEHFIFNLTETDRQLREGIVTFSYGSTIPLIKITKLLSRESFGSRSVQ